MRGTGLHHGKRRYGCVKDQGTVGHCAKTFIVADGIERFIQDDATGRMLQATDYGSVSPAAASDEIQAKLEADQRKLGQLFKDSDDIPTADFDAKRADLKAAIASGKAALGQIQSQQSAALREIAPASGKAWSQLEVARQSAILKLVYSKIIVGPGKPGRSVGGKFPSERITTVDVDGRSFRHGQRGGLITAEQSRTPE